MRRLREVVERMFSRLGVDVKQGRGKVVRQERGRQGGDERGGGAETRLVRFADGVGVPREAGSLLCYRDGGAGDGGVRVVGCRGQRVVVVVG